MRFVIKAYTKKLREVANAVKKFFSDFRPIWKGPADILEKATKKLIDSGDSGWRPLEKSTLKWRSKKGYGPTPLLKASGKMYESFGLFNRTQKKSLEVGTDLPYAASQQFGSTMQKFGGTIPPRPFAVVSDQSNTEISEYVTDKLNNIVQDAIDRTKEDGS